MVVRVHIALEARPQSLGPRRPCRSRLQTDQCLRLLIQRLKLAPEVAAVMQEAGEAAQGELVRVAALKLMCGVAELGKLSPEGSIWKARGPAPLHPCCKRHSRRPAGRAGAEQRGLEPAGQRL